MKNLLLIAITLSSISANAQSFGDRFKKSSDAAQKTYDNMTKNASSPSSLSNLDISKGLKEALSKGAKAAVSKSGVNNGFYENSLIKIPFPKDAQKVKNAAISLGLKNQVTSFEKQLNKAAEQAAAKALPILKEAVLSLTITDALNILNGNKDAATTYLKAKTTSKLTSTFTPIVKAAITAVKLTKYYTPLAEGYNRTAGMFGSKENINPDLTAYITEKALEGLFKLIANEELNIRENPAARTSNILKEVFGEK